jgi:general secretion pathway protein A
MDPDFSGPVPFLTGIARMMGIADSDSSFTEWQIKESIKKVLFRRGIEENKIIVLIIDEGQKLPEFSIEILRELLNYETNQFKLLQIVIFAQPEFSAILKRRENFADRVNIRLRLGPLGFGLMRQMIEHRIELASRIGREPVSFTLPALAAIYLATGGVPRKVIMLCHRVILAMIIRNRTRAGWFLVQSCIGTRLSRRNRRRNLGWGAAVVLGTAAWVIMAGSGGKHSPAVVVGERLTSAYQARIADKTVYPLVPSRAETWQMPLPLVRKSISKMPAGEEPSAPSGQK